jgi:hypothetical protein
MLLPCSPDCPRGRRPLHWRRIGIAVLPVPPPSPASMTNSPRTMRSATCSPPAPRCGPKQDGRCNRCGRCCVAHRRWSHRSRVDGRAGGDRLPRFRRWQWPAWRPSSSCCLVAPSFSRKSAVQTLTQQCHRLQNGRRMRRSRRPPPARPHHALPPPHRPPLRPRPPRLQVPPPMSGRPTRRPHLPNRRRRRRHRRHPHHHHVPNRHLWRQHRRHRQPRAPLQRRPQQRRRFPPLQPRRSSPHRRPHPAPRCKQRRSPRRRQRHRPVRPRPHHQPPPLLWRRTHLHPRPRSPPRPQGVRPVAQPPIVARLQVPPPHQPQRRRPLRHPWQRPRHHPRDRPRCLRQRQPRPRKCSLVRRRSSRPPAPFRPAPPRLYPHRRRREVRARFRRAPSVKERR